MTGGCHFSNLQHVCGDSFHALRSPGVSGAEMEIYERSLQALLSPAPLSRVLARLASLAQIGELARRLLKNRSHLKNQVSLGKLSTSQYNKIQILLSTPHGGFSETRINSTGNQKKKKKKVSQID